jgi:hypothetical protein
MAPPNLVNFPKMWEMTISKPTYLPRTPCTTHCESLENGPNDSTRVRRLTCILRRARVEIFIVVYVGFWLQLSEFSSNLTGHHETKTAKRIWSCRSKYSNFYVKPRLPMTNEDVLDRFLHLPSRQTPASFVIQVRTSPFSIRRTCHNRRKSACFQPSPTRGGG